MSTQAEIDLEARIGDLERQLAELGAKVNPLYSGGMDRYIHSGYLQFDGVPMRWDNTGRQIVVGTSTSDRYFYELLVSQLTTNPAAKYPLLGSGGYVSSTEIQEDISAYLTASNYGRVFVFADNTPSQRGGAEAARGATVAQVFANIGETDDGHVKVKPAILFERVASRPTGLAEGGLWAGTDDKLYFYDGASDIDITGGGGGLKTSGGGYYLIPAGPAVGTNVVGPASAGTYGNWTQMLASAAADLFITGLSFEYPNQNNNYYQWDIGVGGAGSETSVGEVKIGSIPSSSNPHPPVILPFPIPVASGSRIAVRVAYSGTIATTVPVSLLCINQADLVSI